MPGRTIALRAALWGLLLQGSLWGAAEIAAQTPASQPVTHLPTPSGGVGSVAVVDRTMYIAGGFTHVGQAVGSFALLSDAGAAIEPFARVEGEVTAIAPDGAGGWYLAGDLVSVAGTPVRGVARLASDGTPTDLDVIVAGSSSTTKISSMTRIGDRLIIAGDFARINGVNRPQLAALDAQTGALLPWAPALDGGVRRALVDSGSLYLWGGFTTVDSAARVGVARFDGADLELSEWSPVETGDVSAVFVSGDRVYLAGNLALPGGVRARQITAVDGSTGAPVGWSVGGLDSAPAVLLAHENVVYAGGKFSTIGERTRMRVAALDAETASVLPFDVSVVHSFRSGSIEHMAMVSGGLLLSGEFDQINVSKRNGVAIVDPTTGDAEPWDPAIAGTVLCAAAAGADTVAVGGEFTVIGGEPRSSVAAIDLDTGALLPWDVNFRKRSVDPDYSVNSLIATESRVYIGGSFERVDGLVVHGLAAVSPVDGSLDVTFDHGIVSTSSPYGVRSVQRSARAIHPHFHGALYGLNEETGQPLWKVDLGPAAHARADVDSPFVYLLQHSFQQADPPARRDHLAEFDAITGKLTAWDPGADGQVQAVAHQDGRLFVGGRFDIIGGEIRPRFAVFENEDPAARRLAPAPIWEFGFGGADTVRDITTSDDLLMLDGVFSTVRGEPVQDFAALTLPQLKLLDWTVGQDASVALITDREIILVGPFQYFGGVHTPFLAVIPIEGACRVDLDGNGVVDFFDFLEFQRLFAAGDLRADFTGDGVLDFFDFLAFQEEFVLGCP